MSREFLALIIVLALTLGGCVGPEVKQVQICPGRGSVEQSLQASQQQPVSFKANGRCHLVYYDDEKKYDENFPVKLWVNSEGWIYLQGDIAFDQKGLILGANEEEFWLSIRLKELSSYFWGEWSQQDGLNGLAVGPKVLLEAVGLSGTDGEGWSLSNEGRFDILTKQDEQDRPVKRIYIDSCDYLVRKIVYYDDSGGEVIVTELYRFKRVTEDFSVPTRITVVIGSGEKPQDLLKIKLDSVKVKDFSAKKWNRLFTRPQPKRLKHIYRIIDGNAVEQQD